MKNPQPSVLDYLSSGLQTPVLNLETNTLYEGNDFKATCRAPEEKGSLVFRFLRRYRNEEPQTMKTVPATGNSSETTLVLGQAGDYSLYCEYDITLVSGTRRSNHSNEEHVIVKGDSKGCLTSNNYLE